MNISAIVFTGDRKGVDLTGARGQDVRVTIVSEKDNCVCVCVCVCVGGVGWVGGAKKRDHFNTFIFSFHIVILRKVIFCTNL